jgi:hypothetical protein
LLKRGFFETESAQLITHGCVYISVSEMRVLYPNSKKLNTPTSQNPQHRPPPPPPSHSPLQSSPTLQVTAYRRGNHLARRLLPPPAAANPHRISRLPVTVAYRHRLSQRCSPYVDRARPDWGIYGIGFFLSHGEPGNQNTEISPHLLSQFICPF